MSDDTFKTVIPDVHIVILFQLDDFENFVNDFYHKPFYGF